MPRSFLVRNYFKKLDEVEEFNLPENADLNTDSDINLLHHPSEYLEYARSLLALSRSTPWKWDYELEKSYWFDTDTHVQNKELSPSESDTSGSPSSQYGDTFQDLSKSEVENIEKAATTIVSVIKMADKSIINKQIDDDEVNKSVQAIIEEKPEDKTYLQMVCEAIPQEDLLKLDEEVVELLDSYSWENLDKKLTQMLCEDNATAAKNIRQFLDNNQILTEEIAVETGLDKNEITCFMESGRELQLGKKKELYRWFLTKMLRPQNEKADDSYTCYKCGKIFTYKSYLERHIKYVCPDSTGRTWKCGYCGKAFQYPCYLRRHIRSHTGESPYKCDKCDRAFVRSTDLQRHIRNHTGEKPYCCTQCSRAFARSTDLKRHMRTHTVSKPKVQ